MMERRKKGREEKEKERDREKKDGEKKGKRRKTYIGIFKSKLVLISVYWINVSMTTFSFSLEFSVYSKSIHSIEKISYKRYVK